MRLQSDIDALAAIEEDAVMMLKWIGLPEDEKKLEIVICLRQIIDLATYRKEIEDHSESLAAGRGWRDSLTWMICFVAYQTGRW